MGETPSLTFGEELRRERLIREVSLEEISSATKISVRLLTALEKSDLTRLPAPVFTRGFIRSYSRHLGLDPDEMVNAYLADLTPDKAREAGAKRGGLRSRFLRGRRAAASTIVISVTAIRPTRIARDVLMTAAPAVGEPAGTKVRQSRERCLVDGLEVDCRLGFHVSISCGPIARRLECLERSYKFEYLLRVGD